MVFVRGNTMHLVLLRGIFDMVPRLYKKRAFSLYFVPTKGFMLKKIRREAIFETGSIITVRFEHHQYYVCILRPIL